MSPERLFEAAVLCGVMAAPAVLVWRFPVRAAIGVLVYLAFEEALLLAVPDSLYALVRLAPEGLLVVGAFAAWVGMREQGERFETRILWPEMAMLGVLVIGVTVALRNGVSLAFVAIGIRWLFRYSLLYCIWRMAGSASDRRRLVYAISIIVVAQAVIGLAQSGLQVAGIPILELMQANTGTTEVGGVSVVTGGSRQELGQPFYVYGTLGRYHRFGIFVAAGSIVLAFLYAQGLRRDRIAKLGLVACAIAIVLSTSRQAMILVAFTLIATAWLGLGVSKNVARVIRGASLLGLTVAGLVIASGIFASLVGSSALAGRLVNIGTLGFRAYYLAVIVPNVLDTSNYLGFGAGTFGSRPHVMANSDQYLRWGFPGQWSLQFSYDSEWAILLGQYGVLGFLLFYAAIIGFGVLAWRAVRYTQPGSIERVLLSSTACLTLILPVLGAVGAELGSRTTACVVWSVVGASVSWILARRPPIDRAAVARGTEA